MLHTRERFPFSRFLPTPWQLYDDDDPVYSVTRTHGLHCRYLLHNLSDPINRDREEDEMVLISYEVNQRRYDLFTLSDMLSAPYDFDEQGVSNMVGDLAERIARRLAKRFFQTYARHMGRLGGLFDKRFDPKSREGYVVAHNSRFVLKIGKYPNMVLLKKTGLGKWGYQHVTDIDGLFDYRSASQRHMMLMESKSGRIDLDVEHLVDNVFGPMSQLFPDAQLSFVLFSDGRFLFDSRFPEYRILHEIPLRLYNALEQAGIPCIFFDFKESEKDFKILARHLITASKTYHHQRVVFSGRTECTPHGIVIYVPGSDIPYLALRREPRSGLFRMVRAPYRQQPGPPENPEPEIH